MKPEELKAIRMRLGLSHTQMALAIGYDSNKNTKHTVIMNYETGKREIPRWIATTARVLDVGGIADFTASYRGPDDRAEFCRQLSRYLLGAAQ